MPIKVLEMHHHAVRVGTTMEQLEGSRHFYSDVLGLEVDRGRPDISGLPGWWLYVGEGERTAPIHLMGVAETSPADRAAIDPTRHGPN